MSVSSDRVQASALCIHVPARTHVPRGGRVGHGMQLHRQLPKLRESGSRRGEDLSDLGAGQHYGGPEHTPAPSRWEPLAPPQVRFPPASHSLPAPHSTLGGRARSQRGGSGDALPWPLESAVRKAGRTFVDADVMAPCTSGTEMLPLPPTPPPTRGQRASG